MVSVYDHKFHKFDLISRGERGSDLFLKNSWFLHRGEPNVFSEFRKKNGFIFFQLVIV